MKFQLDLDDSDDDPGQQDPECEGNHKFCHLNGEGDQHHDFLNKLEDGGFHSCERYKTDVDSVDESMKGLELNLDDLLVSDGDDSRDDQCTTNANPEKARNTDVEASMPQDSSERRVRWKIPLSDCNSSINTKVIVLRNNDQQAKHRKRQEEINSLPDHLKSLLTALSQVRRMNSSNNHDTV